MSNSAADLFDFLALEMPVPQVKKEGFLDIVEVQYHENTITRIYAYFLNADKHPTIAALFLESLLQLIEARCTKKLDFGNHRCRLEYTTKSGKRIDLLIKTGDKDFKKDDYAIIIENKIFSGVNNDLIDYWETATIADERKIGILLTLKPVTVPTIAKDYFINITHSEWMAQIRLAGLPYDLEPNLYVYLNDFIRNMESIVTNSHGMNDEARFFFKHTAKVLRAKDTLDAAWRHVVNQISVLAEKLGLGIYGNSESWRHIWDYKSQVYYVFGFENTLKPNPTITIYLEVYKDAILRKDELRSLLMANGHYSKLRDDHSNTQSWAHLGYMTYELTTNDLEHLGEFLNKKIAEDFAPAYKLVFDVLLVNNHVTPKL